jgi:hypothetical protein
VAPVPAGNAAHKLLVENVDEVPLVAVDQADDGWLVRQGDQLVDLL